MNDFLIHAARLQDAGIVSLWISLGSNKDGTRLMHVSPAATVTHELAARFPTRTFELDGTDRVLSDLKAELAFDDDGPTAEKVQAAIAAHPLLADDLNEWFEDWQRMPRLDNEDVAQHPGDAALVERVTQRALGMMRGFELAREQQASGNASTPSKQSKEGET